MILRKGSDDLKNSETYKATDMISGFKCRPGLYNLNGASAMFKAVNFTIHSSNATACSVVLFRRGETKPFAIIPIPDSYRIGDTWSIMIYDLDIYEIEYCYRFKGEYAPEKGLLFNEKTNILDPYARAVTGQSRWGKRSGTADCYHGRVCTDKFDWGTMFAALLRALPRALRTAAPLTALSKRYLTSKSSA